MNFRVLLGFAVSMLVVPLQAMAQSAPDDISSHAIDVELRGVTDQRTRGISDSLLRPGAKLSIQAAHESGLIGLVEAATATRAESVVVPMRTVGESCFQIAAATAQNSRIGAGGSAHRAAAGALRSRRGVGPAVPAGS